MPVWLEAGGWGLVAGGALVVGALIAWFVRVPQQVVVAVMAFGAGVLISALSFDLANETERIGGLVPTVVGFLTGALVYVVANVALARRGARAASGHKTSSRAVEPGDPITRKVIYPDGKITVTIAPFASLRNAKLHRIAGEKRASVTDLPRSTRCLTTDLKQGLYIVQVTDAAQPGEGTAQAHGAVTDAVTEAGGYSLHIVISNADGEAKARPATLQLTGWRPGVPVPMQMTDEATRRSSLGPLFPTSTVLSPCAPRSSRSGITTSPPPTAWKFTDDEGSQNDVYGGLEVSRARPQRQSQPLAECVLCGGPKSRVDIVRPRSCANAAESGENE